MLFNSIDFAIFLPTVFILYWIIGRYSLKFQNIFVLLASYFFYGWWDWRFLSLIFSSTLVDFLIGKHLPKVVNVKRRKFLLGISIFVNLGMLGFFKYFNFFEENLIDAFRFFGSSIKSSGLNIILPVGISFYTFQSMSYTIDVYRKKVLPTSNATEFFAFVSFFPQLVAGPIERAKNLLPQFSTKRVFNEKFAVDGLRQILWGLFKKVVIADNCATFSDQIFNNTESYSGSALIMGAVMFSFQMYGDFSGYSDIAIGTSKLFGFRLKRNFAFPYFARDIAEFWRRWHISLSSWFKDYLYFPLGGSRENKLISIRNTTIVFLVSGFWHGANWTFIFWGLLHALFYLPLLILNRNRKNTGDIAPNRTLPSIREFFGIIITFGLATFSRIFFRAEDLDHCLLFC
jgi:alginate O-acetyltransferase complex protein AlgI